MVFKINFLCINSLDKTNVMRFSGIIIGNIMANNWGRSSISTLHSKDEHKHKEQ